MPINTLSPALLFTALTFLSCRHTTSDDAQSTESNASKCSSTNERKEVIASSGIKSTACCINIDMQEIENGQNPFIEGNPVKTSLMIKGCDFAELRGKLQGKGLFEIVLDGVKEVKIKDEKIFTEFLGFFGMYGEQKEKIDYRARFTGQNITIPGHSTIFNLELIDSNLTYRWDEMVSNRIKAKNISMTNGTFRMVAPESNVETAAKDHEISFKNFVIKNTNNPIEKIGYPFDTSGITVE